jgi:hypothetical protein
MASPTKKADPLPIEMTDAGVEAFFFPERNNPQKFGRSCEFGVAIVCMCING